MKELTTHQTNEINGGTPIHLALAIAVLGAAAYDGVEGFVDGLINPWK